MLGRSAYTNPWLISELPGVGATGRTREQVLEAMVDYACQPDQGRRVTGRDHASHGGSVCRAGGRRRVAARAGPPRSRTGEPGRRIVRLRAASFAARGLRPSSTRCAALSPCERGHPALVEGWKPSFPEIVEGWMPSFPGIVEGWMPSFPGIVEGWMPSFPGFRAMPSVPGALAEGLGYAVAFPG